MKTWNRCCPSPLQSGVPGEEVGLPPVLQQRAGAVGEGAVAWWGPLLVALGSGLWGLETLFRVQLQQWFDGRVLVFFEHILALILLAPVAMFAWKGVRLSRRSILWLFISGILGSAVGTTAFTMALSRLNLSVANILLNLQPVVAVMGAHLLLGESLGRGFRRWAALALACGFVLTLPDLQRVSGADLQSLSGLILIGVTIVCWGISTVAGRAIMVEVKLPVAVFLRFVLGALGAAVLVMVQGKGGVMVEQLPLLARGEVLQAYAMLLLVAGLTPLVLYFWGLSRTPATAGAFCEMVQALVAVVLSWAYFGHKLQPFQVMASLVLLISVIKINLIQSRRSDFAN